MKILHQLQSLLARVLGLNVSGMIVPGMKQQVLFPLHQIFICRTVVLPQLRQFWDTVRSELANKSPYIVSIRGMKMRLSELQDDDKEAIKLRLERLSKG